MSEHPGVLNLAGADTSGFDAIPSGPYDVHVERASWESTKGGDEAKLPKGTPMLNVAFVVDEGEFEGRWLWDRYVIPPADYEKEKRDRMNGAFVRFLMALGYDEEEVTSGEFELELEDLIGKECSVNVGQRKYEGEMQNTVRSVKPRGEATAETGLL